MFKPDRYPTGREIFSFNEKLEKKIERKKVNKITTEIFFSCWVTVYILLPSDQPRWWLWLENLYGGHLLPPTLVFFGKIVKTRVSHNFTGFRNIYAPKFYERPDWQQPIHEKNHSHIKKSQQESKHFFSTFFLLLISDKLPFFPKKTFFFSIRFSREKKMFICFFWFFYGCVHAYWSCV